MSASKTMRNLAASTAVVLAFAPLAQAGGLLDSNAAVNTYTPLLITAIADASKDSRAQLASRGFIAEFEKNLSSPGDKPKLIKYPDTQNSDLLLISAVIPPAAGISLPIPVCAQQYGKVVGAWNITAKGEVIPRAIVANPEGSTKGACQATLVAAKKEMDQALITAQAPAGGATVALAAARP